MTTPTHRRRSVTKKGRTGPFVKYVGTAAKRTIAASDWRQLGFTATRGHEWSEANDYLVESAQFSDEQLDYLLIDDVGPNGQHDFIEADYDEDHDLVQVAR